MSRSLIARIFIYTLFLISLYGETDGRATPILIFIIFLFILNEHSSDYINKTELNLLKKDAYRYRKLRKCHWSDGGITIVESPESINIGVSSLTLGNLDNEVDKLIEK